MAGPASAPKKVAIASPVKKAALILPSTSFGVTR